MSEETTEVTEPVVSEPTTTAISPEIQAMLNKLNEIGIESPEQLENKAKAASESGRLANIVGELREEISKLKSQPQPTAKPEYGEGEIDIEAAIGSAVSKALDVREAKAKQLHAARTKEAQAIRSSRDYNVVGKEFEQYMNSPDANFRLNNGDTPTTIFNDMVKDKYRNMMVEMKAAVESSSGNPGQTAIPHMESTQTAPPRVTAADDKSAKLKKVRENWAGNDEDIDRALNALLPSGSLPMPNR